MSGHKSHYPRIFELTAEGNQHNQYIQAKRLNGTGGWDDIELPDGPTKVIEYTAYQSLLTQNESLKADYDKMQKLVTNQGIRDMEQLDKIAELEGKMLQYLDERDNLAGSLINYESKIAELQAENAKLKSDILDIISRSSIEGIYNWGAPLRKIRERINSGDGEK